MSQYILTQDMRVCVCVCVCVDSLALQGRSGRTEGHSSHTSKVNGRLMGGQKHPKYLLFEWMGGDQGLK
jgi:hypothetical protein